MRKIFATILFGLALATTSCSDGGDDAGAEFKVSAPVVSHITQQGAHVEATASFAPADYRNITVGFLYGLTTESVATQYREVAAKADGTTVAADITGLKADANYTVYALFRRSGVRTLGEPARFRTAASGTMDESPELEVVSDPNITFEAAGGSSTILYNIYHAPESATAIASCDAQWIRLDDSRPGRVEVVATRNDGEERTAAVTLSYGECRDEVVSITQLGADNSGGDDNGGGDNGGGNNNSSARYSGWAELPAEVEKSGDYYYAYHRRADKESVRNYSVCYSAEMRSALWTAMPIHSSYDGNAGRNDSWDYDPIIPRSVQPVLGSSYSGVYSRGHMVASSDRQVSVATNRQTFYYTNMAPQYQNHFNGGIWQKLENWCWDEQNCSDTLYVVTGAHYANKNKTCSDNDGNRVVVPTHFYKLLIRSKSGRTGKALSQLPADDIKCVGFWFEHNESYATNERPSSKQMKSVSDIERLTGLTFFPNVPNAPKSSYTASEWGM